MERFEEFLNERKYLLNVSHKTLVYYNCAFQSWRKHGGEAKQWVINLRQAGLLPVSVNTYICAMNAYWKWAGEGTHLAYLKEEQKLLNTFSAEHVKGLLGYRPKGCNETRAHTVACLLLDTGLRISEALGLAKEDVDFESMTLRVLGKGNKHRMVPFSNELRKILWRYSMKQQGHYLFGTRNNTRPTVRNFQRDFKQLGKRVGITGIRMSPHTCRHSFACEYLRRGGNLEFLRRILGHSSILTTQKYLKSLGVEDLKAVHNGLSLLSR